MSKIFLTGASGFIGSYFIKHYQKKYDIATFSFLKDDFDNLELYDVNAIIHLSALVHQMGGAPYEEYYRVNVKQTLDLAKRAKASGVKQFVFMSSVKVYGEESEVSYTEATPCRPQDDYGKSKLEAENELKKLEDDNFKVAIIRTPIVYGHGVKANIENLVNLVKKVPLLPLGKIRNRRSMIYVGNLSFFIDAIIEKQVSGIFLVADEKPLSTTRLIELIAEALDKKVFFIHVPFFEGLLKLLKPSFHKRLFESLELDNQDTMKRLFGKTGVLLPFSVEDGIRLMIEGE